MQFEYIDENLNTILQNQGMVLYLKPYDVRNKRALFAIVREGEGEGVYKKLQITKEQSKWTFPFEPIHYFRNGPGYFYLKDFIVSNNYIALNVKNLEGFMSKNSQKNNKIVNIFATFNDGTSVFLKWKNAKRFEKENGLKNYINLLNQRKGYVSPNFSDYEILDFYIGEEDTFSISSLQNKEGLKRSKKLGNI